MSVNLIRRGAQRLEGCHKNICILIKSTEIDVCIVHPVALFPFREVLSDLNKIIIQIVNPLGDQ